MGTAGKAGQRRGVGRVGEVIAPARLGGSFRWLLASSWVSNLGDGMVLAAGPLLVASQTRDPFLVGLAVVLQRLPWLFFALVAGVTADRFDRRRIMIGVHFTRAAILFGLSGAIVADRVHIATVLMVMFLLGTAETFADTTAATLLPMLVAKEDLGLGNVRFLVGVITLNQLAGPPLGAALFAVDPALPFLGQGIGMVTSALATVRVVLPRQQPGRAARRRVGRDISEGFRWLSQNPAVRTLAITIVSFNVTFGAAISVLVLYASERLRSGDVGFGLLTTATAVGGLVGTAAYGRLTARVGLGDIMRAGLIIETLTHLALALSTRLWLALVVMVVFGAHAFVWATTSTTLRQQLVPTALQGRVSALYLLGVQGGLVLGGLLGGSIADAWGVVAPFWFGFFGSATLVVLLWRQLPHLTQAHDASLSTGGPDETGWTEP